MGFPHILFSITITFCLTSIVVQSFGELLVLRHPTSADGSKRKLTCVSDDDDSALIWNYDYPTDGDKKSEEDFQPRKPKPANISECAIWWNSTICRAQWENISGWEAVNSSVKPMAPVFDFRWEGFREFSSGTPAIDNADYQYIGKVDDSSGSAAFSVRGIRNVHVFLCENADPTNGACLWIFMKPYKGDESLLRPCRRGVNRGKEPLRKKICGDESYTTRSTDEDLFYQFEWRTFRLKWMKEENKTQVFRYNDPEDRPFLEAPWSSPPHILIRAHEGTRLRFHFYEYFLTRIDNSVLNTKEFRYHGEHFCIDLLVSLCPKCKLRVSLVSDHNTTLMPWVIPGNDKSAEEGTLTWRSVRLIKSAQITDPILVRLKIETVLMGGEGKGRWAIDNFRMCEPVGQVRKSTITISRDKSAPYYSSAIWPHTRCQRLSYTKSAVVELNSVHIIDNGTIESQRYIDELVESCGSSCQSFGANYSLWNSIGFTCGRGFSGSDCNEQCPSRNYGYNCNGVCAAACSHGSCNQITGDCDSGCVSNTFLPPRCETEIKDFTVTNVTATTATVSLKIEPEADEVANLGVEILVKANESPMKFTVNLEKSKTPSYYVAHISGLTTDTIYTASATAKLADQTGPEISFTTICIGDPRFAVETSETYLTLEMKNHVACFNNPDPVYSVLVYDPANVTKKWKYDDVRFPASIDKLTPWTEYQVNISHMTINKSVFTSKVRTLESAPSEVRNLISTSITENSVTLQWNPPLQRNGYIRYYSVSVTLVELIACKGSEGTGHYNQQTSRNVDKTTVTIHGLHPYAEYQARVTAYTSEPGEPETVRFNTLATDIPTSKFSNLSIGNNNETLYWDEPADCTTVTGLTNTAKLLFESIDDSIIKLETTIQTVDKHFNLYKLNNLTPYTMYRVRLYIARDYNPEVNPEVNPSNYQELTWRTPPAAPAAATNLEIYEADPDTNTIFLRLVSPDPANGEIESYHVSINTGGVRRKAWTLKVSEGMATCELGRNYVCFENVTLPLSVALDAVVQLQVSAKNKGVGEPGAPSYLVFVPDDFYNIAPGDPLNLRVTPQGHGMMVLTWAPPSFTHTKITGFEIFVEILQTDLLDNSADTQDPITFDYNIVKKQNEYSMKLSLLPSTVYRFSVVAVNRRNQKSDVIETERLVPGSIGLVNETERVRTEGTFIEIKIPAIVNATRNSIVKVIVKGSSRCTPNQSQKLSPLANLKRPVMEWEAARYQPENSVPKTLRILVEQNHGVMSDCSLHYEETHTIVFFVLDWYSGTSATLTTLPFTPLRPGI